MRAQNAHTFAVGSEEITFSDSLELVEKLTKKIDARLESLPVQNRIVTLRVDKDVPFERAQYALAALAESSAANIQLAAFKEHRTPSSPD
jgi:biopolymer transport protein ExbD